MMLVVSAMCSAAQEERKLPAVPVPGSAGTGAMYVENGRLYLAGKRKLQIYDVASEPLKPRLIAELKGLPYTCRQMKVSRGYAYITAREAGLWIADVRNAEKPKLIGGFDTAELATGVEISGNLLCVAQRHYGVQFFDISDPEHPRELNCYRTDEAQSVCCRGNLLAVGNWGRGNVLLLDISDTAAPKELSRILLDGYGDGVSIRGNYLYASTGHHARRGSAGERFGRGHGVEIFDISNPRKPVRTGGVKLPRFYALGNDCWSVYPAGRFLIAADTGNGAFVIDGSDVRKPELLASVRLTEIRVSGGMFNSSVPVPEEMRPEKRYRQEKGMFLIPDCVGAVASGRDCIYIAGIRNGLFVAEFSGLRPVAEQTVPFSGALRRKTAVIPGFQRYECGGMVRDAVANGDFLYVAASVGGLQIWRKTERGMERKQVIPQYTAAVAVSGNLLVSGGNNTLSVWKILPDGSLTAIGTMRSKIGISYLHLYCGGAVAAFGNGSNRLDFADLRDPSAPRPSGSVKEGRLLALDPMPETDIDGMIAVNAHAGGLSWYRLSPERVEKVANQPFRFDSGDGVAVMAGCFLIPARRRDGYHLFGTEDYKKAGNFTLIRTPHAVSGLPACDGGSIAFSHRRNGTVALLKTEHGGTPDFLRSLNLLPGTPGRVVFWQGRLVIPAGFGGLFVETEKFRK